MTNLTVLTVVENDPGLLELMIKSVLRFTDLKPNFIICDNSNGKNKKRIDAIANDIRVVNNSPKFRGGSNAHGEGIQRIFPLVKTEWTAIVESDCIVSHNDWWKTDCDIKASIKGKGLYHMCFVVFKTNIVRNIDFRPGTTELDRASRTNYKPKRDVGWRFSECLDPKATIDYVDFVDCKSGKGVYFDKTFQSDEFHWGGKCICCHAGRGSNIRGKAVRDGFKHPVKQMDGWKKIANEVIEK